MGWGGRVTEVYGGERGGGDKIYIIINIVYVVFFKVKFVIFRIIICAALKLPEWLLEAQRT